MGSGLVLQDNLGDNLSITGNGAFTFATPVADGSAYAVTVLTSPSSPSQTCTVTGGQRDDRRRRHISTSASPA